MSANYITTRGPRFQDLTARRFGSLTVVKQGPHGGKKVRWWCTCDCGLSSILVQSANLIRTGNTTKCRQHPHKHGASRFMPPEYRVWIAMRDRCNNRQHPSYHNYGGRGLQVCSRWKSFNLFLDDMGRRPTDKHSLDRIDNNGNYSPQNCRWATLMEQSNNTRRSRYIMHKGSTKTIAEWSRVTGISEYKIRYHHVVKGLSLAAIIRLD